MQLNHRITFVWFWTLLFLVILVIYLDGGLGNEPIVVFIVPMVFNIICGAIIATKLAAKYRFVFRGVQSIRTIDNVTIVYSIVMLTCKVLFELFLCCRLRGMAIDLLFIFIPLWIFVFVGVVVLFYGVIETHLKTV